MELLRRLGPLTVCATVALLLLPAGAAAQAGPGGQPQPPVFLFSLEGTDHYEVDVVVVGRTVALEARRGYVTALYVVRGRVSPSRIVASFGKLGRIAVEFEAVDIFSGRRIERAERCRHGSPLEFVSLRGTIAFRGEQDYTSVDTRRAFGLLIDPAGKLCRRQGHAAASAGFGYPPLNTLLTAIARRNGAVTSFELSRSRGKSQFLLEALRQERRGRIRIVRQAVTAMGGENAFIASGPGVQPAFAFVKPPKPFSGSALYQGGAGGGWTGSLSAWLPGAGKVALTGENFALSFCRRAADEPGCNPLSPVRKPLSLLQGSGSQAHALGDARLSWSRYLLNSASSAGSTP